jgi:hypothetical protein
MSSFVTPVDGGRRGRRAGDRNFGNQNLRLISNVLDVFGFFCKKVNDMRVRRLFMDRGSRFNHFSQYLDYF